MSPLAEQGDGVRALQLAELAGALGRQGKGRHPPHGLAPNLERLPAGGQDRHPGAVLQQAIEDAGHGLDQVLAVVHHHQQLATFQVAAQPVIGGLARGSQRVAPGPGTGQKLVADEVGVGQGGELGEPHAVGEAIEEPGGDLDGKTGLAHATDADEGDEAGGAHQRGHLGDSCSRPPKGLRRVGRL